MEFVQVIVEATGRRPVGEVGRSFLRPKKTGS